MILNHDLIKKIFNDIKNQKNLNVNLSTLNSLLKENKNQKDLLILKGILLSQLNSNEDAEKLFPLFNSNLYTKNFEQLLKVSLNSYQYELVKELHLDQ